MRLTTSLLFVCLFLLDATFINCWESYELDLFDLVEEVGQNFYEYFGLTQQSDSNEIKKAYRKLSLVWHPDKNDDPDAEKKFRNIASIYDVLKDDVKRERYDQILEFGLPDWRQPIYYFRRVRKLNTSELAIAISIIISVGHYFVMWAQYFEKKLTLEDRMDEVKKRLEKKQKKKKTSNELDEMDATLQEWYNTMPQPSLKNTLPIRFSIWTFSAICATPKALKSILAPKPVVKEVSIEINESVTISSHKNNSNSQLHKSLNPTRIENAQITPVIPTQTNSNPSIVDSNSTKQINKNKEWTDKEKADLIKAVVKFPAGSSNRWNRIAEFVETRTVNDCISMEKQMKTNFNSSLFSNLNAATWNQNGASSVTDAPTLADNQYNEEASSQVKKLNWTQEQQSLFEKALKQFTKETPNRWERISESVPGKSKDECIERFKTLCESLKKK